MAELTLAAADAANAGAFLARLVRLDPAAVVRLRPADEGRLALWGRLPWEPLVTRLLGEPGRPVAGVDDGPEVSGLRPRAADVTVAAADLLARLGDAGSGGVLALPERRDAQWRWSLPPERGRRIVETLPPGQLRELAVSAERAIRGAVANAAARGAAVGERVIRDALLDHVPIVVQPDVSNPTGEPVEVPQRLVQAVVRMGFVRTTDGPEETDVRVLIAGKFVGLAAEYGVSWYRPLRGREARLIV